MVKAVDTLNINETEIQNISLSSDEQSVAPKLAADRDNYDDDHVSIVYGPRFVSKRQICLLLKLPPPCFQREKNTLLVLFRFQIPVLARR